MIHAEIIRTLGMTLVHSFWQGFVALILVTSALLLAGKSNARIRYAVLFSGLMLLFLAFLATWCILYFRIHPQSLTVNMGTRVNEQIPLFTVAPLSLIQSAGSYSIHDILELSYPVLAIGWILGFLFMAVRTAGGLYLSFRIIRRDVFLPYPSLQKVFVRVRNRMAVTGMVQLRLTARKISPLVIGLLKPVVILPVSVLTGMSTEQVEAILVHELAHIRRYDHFAMIIQSVATQVLFFHPLVWYLSAEINRERENCCDDLVMKIFPNPIDYIKALAMLQELHISGPVPANALVGRTKNLLVRITRILKPETTQTSVYRITMVFMLLITLGIAAVTLATSGNSVSENNIALIQPGEAEKPVVIPDTTKTKAGKNVVKQDESYGQEDKKREKDIEDARRELEKAERELEKAREEMEKARRELERAQVELQELDPAARIPEIMPMVPDLPDLGDFRYAFRNDGHEHWRNLQEELNRAQEDMKHIRREELDRFREEWERSGEQRKELREALSRSREEMLRNMRQFREEDWEKYREEWQRSREEMKRAMEEFHKTWKDSSRRFPGPYWNMPLPPIPPPVFKPGLPHEVPHVPPPDTTRWY